MLKPSEVKYEFTLSPGIATFGTRVDGAHKDLSNDDSILAGNLSIGPPIFPGPYSLEVQRGNKPWNLLL